MRAKKLYKRAVKFYGWKRQYIKFTEEIGEVLQAAAKHEVKKNKKTRFNLADEIADAKIVLCQLEAIYAGGRG